MEEIVSSVLENLLVAVIGGSFMLLYSKSLKKYKQVKLEKKYPISGEYISTFEDIVDDKIITSKAPVQLSQKGKEIKGTTEMDSRIWILEGEISDSGYIYGIYFAESIHDKGVGNFFLEFTNDGDLEGLWSGYDSINKKIVSGRYFFKKRPTIVINKVLEKNLPTILHIADKQLGKDYINANDFMQDDFLKFQASIDNKIVGFITSKEITIEDVYQRVPSLKDKNLNQFNVVSKLSYIGSIAIDPVYEGLGVATALFQHILKELNKKDNVILMTGWKSKNGTNISGIAKQHGFDEILEIKDFWKEDSIDNHYDCPVCGNPCLCSAILYVKHGNNT